MVSPDHALFGLLLISALLAWQVRAMLVGILDFSVWSTANLGTYWTKEY